MAVTVAEMQVKAKADTSQLESGLSRASSAVTGFAKLLTVGTAAATAGLAGAMAVGVKAAGDLQQSVANISTIKPEIDTKGVFNALNEMQTRVPQSAKQLGDSLYDIFSSFDVGQEQALKLTETFAKGATGAQTDAQTFGTAVMGVMNAYKLSAEDAAHVSDVFFNTVNKGVVTGQELASSLGPVVQSAKAAGVGLDDLGGFIAGVTKEGGPAAQNINNLNNLFQKFTTEKAQKAIRDLGVKTTTSSGDFRPMIDVLADVKPKLDDMTESARAAYLQKMFPDAQARQGAQTIISQLDFVKQAIDDNKTSTGSAASAYEKMVNTFNSQSKILGNTLRSILTTVGANILPSITPLLKAFNESLPAAFKTAGQAIRAFMDVAKGGEGGAMTGLLARFLPPDLAQRATEIMTDVVSAIRSAVPQVVSAFQQLAPKIVGVVQQLAPQVLNVLRTLATGVVNGLRGLFDLGKTLAPILVAAFHGIVAAIQPVLPLIAQLGQFIAQHMGTIAPIVLGVVAAFAGLSAVAGIIASIAGVVGTISGIVAAFSALFAVLGTSGTASVLLAGLIAVLGGPLTIALGAAALLIAGFAVAWSQNWGGIQEKTAAVVSELSTSFQHMQEVLGPALSAIAQALVDANLGEKFSAAFDFIRDFDLGQKIKDANWGEDIKAAAGEAFDELKNANLGEKVASAVGAAMKDANLGGAMKDANLGPKIKEAIELEFDELKKADLGPKITAALNAAFESAKNADLRVGIKELVEAEFDELKNADLGSKLVSAVKPAFDALKNENLGGQLKEEFRASWESMTSDASAAWNSIQSTLSGIWESIKSTGSSVVEGIKGAWRDGWADIQSTASSAWSTIQSIVTSAVNAIEAAIRRLIALVPELAGSFPNATRVIEGLGSAASAAAGFANGLAGGISAAAGAASAAVGPLRGALGALQDIAGAIPGLGALIKHSPVPLAEGMKEVGVQSRGLSSDLGTLRAGLSDLTNESQRLGQSWQQATDVLIGQTEEGLSVWQSTWDQYLQSVRSTGDSLNNYLTHLPDSFQKYMQTVRETGDYLNDWLTHLPQGVQSAMRDIGQAFAAAGTPPYWMLPGSLPPLAQGLKDIGEQAAAAVSPATAGAAALQSLGEAGAAAGQFATTTLDTWARSTAALVDYSTQLRGAESGLRDLNAELRQLKLAQAMDPENEALAEQIKGLTFTIQVRRDLASVLKESIAGWQAETFAIDGYVQALNTLNVAGPQALNIQKAFIKALSENDQQSGIALAQSVQKMIQDATKVLTENPDLLAPIQNMGDQVKAAFRAALESPSEETINAAMALLDQFASAINQATIEQTDRIKAAGTLTAETFAQAIAGEQSKAALGSAGVALIEALTTAMEKGGQAAIDKAANATRGMQDELKKLPDFVRGRLTAEFDAAFQAFITQPTQEGLNTLRGVVERVNQTLQMIPDGMSDISPAVVSEIQGIIQAFLDMAITAEEAAARIAAAMAKVASASSSARKAAASMMGAADQAMHDATTIAAGKYTGAQGMDLHQRAEAYRLGIIPTPPAPLWDPEGDPYGHQYTAALAAWQRETGQGAPNAAINLAARGFASGGVVKSDMPAFLHGKREPEVVSPLSDLPKLLMPIIHAEMAKRDAPRERPGKPVTINSTYHFHGDLIDPAMVRRKTDASLYERGLALAQEV